MGTHRFFVNKISDGKAVIQGDDFEHAVKVLRLKEGDEIAVFNYEYGEYRAEVKSIDLTERSMEVRTGEIIRARERKASKITAITALIKKDKMEMTLEKLTELGIDRIIPLITNRTVIKIKDEEKKEKRWEAIIYSAVKQCGRLSTPELFPVIDGVKNIKLEDNETGFFIYEKEENNFLIDQAIKLSPGTDSCFIIGPEGGFDPAEADEIIKKGFMPVSIGDTILREETAAIAAGTVLVQALRRSRWKN
jgi:16S rRNA (uracil1498-N3)-methyltransferase